MKKRLVALMALFAAGAAFAQGGDVGLANLVSGSVTYRPVAGGAVKPVSVFSTIRDGDRIEIAPGAQLRVVFFDGGRQERWLGPASFRAAKGGATPISGKPAETTTLPAAVPQRIARVPELVQHAKLGGVQVRGGVTLAQKASLEQQEAVAKARETYEAMRKDAAADDITPELFLYVVLHDYLLYDDMKVAVEEMLRRQPASEEAKALAHWLHTRAAR